MGSSSSVKTPILAYMGNLRKMKRKYWQQWKVFRAWTKDLEPTDPNVLPSTAEPSVSHVLAVRAQE